MNPIGNRRRTAAEALEHLRRNSSRDGACIVWTGPLDGSGYGVMTWKDDDGCRQRVAHRIAYRILVGPIPSGLHIDHLCRVRACVNPSHLEAVTPQENNMRSTSWSAVNARKTHCVRGHEFDDENTAYVPGGRSCRACSRLRTAAWRSRRRGALAS